MAGSPVRFASAFAALIAYTVIAMVRPQLVAAGDGSPRVATPRAARGHRSGNEGAPSATGDGCRDSRRQKRWNARISRHYCVGCCRVLSVPVASTAMVVNHEVMGEPPAGWRGGFGVYDVSDPAKPREITRWQTSGTGMHRFDFDGRYLYGSPTFEGYVGNIMGIFDLKDPTRPQEVGRWWMPGQWVAGGETPSWKGTMH